MKPYRIFICYQCGRPQELVRPLSEAIALRTIIYWICDPCVKWNKEMGYDLARHPLMHPVSCLDIEDS